MRSLPDLPSVNCANEGVTLVITPYRPGNKDWLRGILGRPKPKWNPLERAWSIPRVHALAVAVAASDRWGACELVTWARLDPTVKCDVRCLEARGDDCTCSCGGINHRAKALPGGFVVGDTTVLVLGDQQLIRRLIRRGA